MCPFIIVVIHPFVRAWEQLTKDGYAYSTDRENSATSKTTRFFITISGLRAIETCPFFLRGKPYKWKIVQGYISIIWKIATIVAILLNALIVLLFTYLTYIKP